MLIIGEIIDKRYELTGRADSDEEGTQADVYFAKDLLLDEEVVVRVAKDPGDAADFKDQYRVQRLHGRNLVRAYHYGEIEPDCRPFVVVEALRDAETFTSWSVGKPIPDLLAALADVADAVAELHEAGLRHGDLAGGGNILVQRGRVVLIDTNTDYRSSAVSFAPLNAAQQDFDLLGFDHLVRGTLSHAQEILAGLELKPEDRSLRTRATRLRGLGPTAATLGELGYQDIKTVWMDKFNKDKERFLRLMELRQSVIQSFHDRLSLIAADFGGPVGLTTTSDALAELFRRERESASRPKSELEALSTGLQFGADRLELRVNQTDPHQFERPWPGKPVDAGQVDVGWLYVMRNQRVLEEADHKVIIREGSDGGPVVEVDGRDGGITEECLKRIVGLLLIGRRRDDEDPEESLKLELARLPSSSAVPGDRTHGPFVRVFLDQSTIIWACDVCHACVGLSRDPQSQQYSELEREPANILEGMDKFCSAHLARIEGEARDLNLRRGIFGPSGHTATTREIANGVPSKRPRPSPLLP